MVGIRRIPLFAGLTLMLALMGGLHDWVPVMLGGFGAYAAIAIMASRRYGSLRLVFTLSSLIDPLFNALLFWAVGPDPLLRIMVYCFWFPILVNNIPLLSVSINRLASLTSVLGFLGVALISGIPLNYLTIGAIMLLLAGLTNSFLVEALRNGFRTTLHFYSGLKSRREQMARISQEKADFLANMNHELRTPLNGIIGMSGLLLGSPLPPEQEEYARTIRSSSELLLALINDILDMSRAEAGRLQIEQRPFELAPVISLVADNLKAAARDKGIALSVVYATPIPRVIIGDATRINQILFNLVGNAIKFTNFGRVSITISVHPDPQGADQSSRLLRLAISDTGIGIPAGELDNIFDKYRQASIDIHRKFGGTGLGLAITRELINRMNGSITVSSEFGKGSVFTSTIPCRVGEETDPPPQDDESAHRIAQSMVLLADDNPVNLNLLGRMTRNFGCQTREVRDGIEALEALKQMVLMNRINLAILDYQMPGLNGWEVVHELRIWETAHRCATIPVVILTGHLGSMLEPAFQNLANVEIVEKPIRMHQLKAIVDKHVGIVQTR
jgi:signal transduction histidine kinase/CheY-like chemotaxis protein